MKNQYVGDIGDYGKYSLLRFLALRGIKIGVNWYLTDNDNSSDGNITDYLKKDSDKSLDPDVFITLKEIVEQNDRDLKSVQMIQDTGLIPGASFFEAELSSYHTSPMKRAWDRRLWYEQSKLILRDADLIFADPDNGITYRKTARHKGCEKFVLPEETAQYYYDGKDVVFYCHKGRRTKEEWERTKIKIKEYVCDAKLFVLTFHRGTQRSYLFVVHPEHADRYELLLSDFLSSSPWGASEAFTREELIESNINTTPDLCQRRAVLNYFTKAFITKREKEMILKRMTNEQIDELAAASLTHQEKDYFRSFRGTGLAAPTIGVVHPKGSTVVNNEDGTITIVLPSETLN